MNRTLRVALFGLFAFSSFPALAESRARPAVARAAKQTGVRFKHKAYVMLDMDDTVGDTSEVNRRVMSSLATDIVRVSLTPAQQKEIRSGLNEREQYEYMVRLYESAPSQRVGAHAGAVPSYDTWLESKRRMEATISTEPGIATLLPFAKDLIHFSHEHPDVTLGFASNRNGKVLGNMIDVLDIHHVVPRNQRVGAADLKDEHGRAGDRLKPHPDAIVLLMKKSGIDLAKVKTQADVEALRALHIVYAGDAYSDYVAVNNTNAFVREELGKKGLRVDDLELIQPIIVETGHISEANRKKLPPSVIATDLGTVLTKVKTAVQ